MSPRSHNTAKALPVLCALLSLLLMGSSAQDPFQECWELSQNKDWGGLRRTLITLDPGHRKNYKYPFYMAMVYYSLGYVDAGDFEAECCRRWMKADAVQARVQTANKGQLVEARKKSLKQNEATAGAGTAGAVLGSNAVGQGFGGGGFIGGGYSGGGTTGHDIDKYFHRLEFDLRRDFEH